MDLLKFLPVARAMAELSKDPAVKLAALIIDDDGNLLSSGWNGFPRGVMDAEHRLTNRGIKLLFVVHAEANAIAQAARTGARLKGASIIITERFPCSSCAGLIIQSGIKRVYAPLMDPSTTNSEWFESQEVSAKMFVEAGVGIFIYDSQGKIIK
jgi:dCMP deaminase